MKRLAILLIIILLGFILLTMLKFCCPKDETIPLSSNFTSAKVHLEPNSTKEIIIEKNILIESYFRYIDSVVGKHQSLTRYNLSEHILVRANPWIIDTFQNTDYYRMKARDSFVYNQKKMIALPKGNSIVIPDSIQAKKIQVAFEKTVIDINIPEYKLRINEDSTLLFEFPIRVGRDEKKVYGNVWANTGFKNQNRHRSYCCPR